MPGEANFHGKRDRILPDEEGTERVSGHAEGLGDRQEVFCRFI
jgi:hypothetical protein